MTTCYNGIVALNKHMVEIKVDGYGDMLSKVKGKPCIAFKMFGSYQGEWVAAFDGCENIELWKGYYGSCSSCDWIEGHQEYNKEIARLADLVNESLDGATS